MSSLHASASPEAKTSTNRREPLSVALGIPTRGRAQILKETLADLKQQTLQPSRIFVAYMTDADIGDAAGSFPEVRFLQGAGLGGSCSQRNILLDAAGDAFDLIVIMDDDCNLHRDYLKRIEEAFARDPAVMGATGKILENGALGPGLTGEYARALLARVGEVPGLAEQPPLPAFNTDGSNMAFRAEVLVREHLRFDEEMPGYAWYEDIDFSRRFLPFGTLIHVGSAQAVHLGAKVGKTSGKRYGYSQVANPLYLVHKGTYFWRNAFVSIGRNFLANLAKSIVPEPYIDRRGRLLGNLLAFRDLLLGRSHPRRILDL